MDEEIDKIKNRLSIIERNLNDVFARLDLLEATQTLTNKRTDIGEEENINEDHKKVNPKIEELNKKSLDEIKKEIESLISDKDINYYEIGKYIDDFLLNYDLIKSEIPYEHKLQVKLEKVRKILEQEIIKKQKETELNKKRILEEINRKINEQKEEIINSMVQWAKSKSITWNVLSMQDVPLFLKEKGIIPKDTELWGGDFRSIWLEVKGKLRND